jgi:transposase
MGGAKEGSVPAKRRWRSLEERRAIVEESLGPGASVARVARAHGVNANQVFHWRSLYRRGMLGGATAPVTLLPVRLAEEPAGELSIVATGAEPVRDHVPAPDTASPTPGTIHIQLAKARVRIEGSADPSTLRAVLKALRG